MHKIKKISAVLVAVAVVGGGILTYAASSNGPSRSVQTFYTAAKQGEVDTAQKYIANEVIKLYDNPNISYTITQGIKREAEKYEKIEPLEDTIKITGDLAAIDVKVTFKDGTTKTETFNLIKEDNRWKLLFQ